MYRRDAFDRSLAFYRLRWRKSWPTVCIVAVVALFVVASWFNDSAVPQGKHVAKEWLTDDCKEVVDRFQAAEIQLLAFDFDQTIVDVHTGGRWSGSAEELASHVRVDFACVIGEALDRDLGVSVVTFSTQLKLISEVLHLRVPGDRTIPVFGLDDSGFADGKRNQLRKSVDYFHEHTTALVGVGPSATVLIDDDTDNIRMARNDGYYTIAYTPGRRLVDEKLSKP